MTAAEIEARIAEIDAERSAHRADERRRLVSALRSARTLARKLGEFSPEADAPPAAPKAPAAKGGA